MRFPILAESQQSKSMIEQFTGIDTNLRASEGTWNDMENMTTDYFPVASTRDKRSTQRKIEPCYFHVNNTAYVPISIESAVCIGNNIISLHSLNAESDEKNDYAGCWFKRNNINVSEKYLNLQWEKIKVNKIIDNKTVTFFSNKIKKIFANSGELFYLICHNYSNVQIGSSVQVQDFQIQIGMFKILSLEDGKIIFVVSSDNDIEEINKADEFSFNFMNNDKPSRVTDAISCFEQGKHNLITMGTKVFSLPDCVCYETKNSQYAVPVIPVNKKVSYEPLEKDSIRFMTVVKDKSSYTGYSILAKNLTDKVLNKKHLISTTEKTAVANKTAKYTSDCYRISSGMLQQYLEDSKMWVNVEGYTMIAYSNNISNDITTKPIFFGYNVGDVITITNSSNNPETAVFATNADNKLTSGFKGLIHYSNGKYTEANVQILKKGLLEDGRYYAIVPGISYCVVNDESEYQNTQIPYVRDLEGTISFERKKPDVSHIGCCSHNRIWTCSKDGHEIYASALADPYNFYRFEGITTDSVGFNVGTDGKFTGCIEYNGHPLFFKEDSLHYISGMYATNNGVIDGNSFDVNEYLNFNGVESGSERSLVVINGLIYYKSRVGIVACDGTSTRIISEALGKERYKDAIAGSNGNKYYIAMTRVRDNKQVMFVYDTEKGTWCKENANKINQFLSINNSLTYIEDVGKSDISGLEDAQTYELINVAEDDLFNLTTYKVENSFDWYAETGNIGLYLPNNKYVSRFQVRLQLDISSKVRLYIKYDNQKDWQKITEMIGNGLNSYTIPIIPYRCDYFKLRFEGTGQAKIISLTKILEEGGDI